MVEMYKLTHNIYDNEAYDFIRYWKDSATRNSNRGNSLKIYSQRELQTESVTTFFAFRATSTWTSLPKRVVSAQNTNTFKNRLDKHWSNQDLVYDNFKAIINNYGSFCSENIEFSGEEAGNHL